jgi:rubrerythrin
MKEILDVIHKTIYQFFDVCGDDEEVPISDKDKLLLEVNKAICNNLKALEQEPFEDAVSRAEARRLIAETDRIGGISCRAFKTLYNGIDNLPSITPKQKMGRWIYTGDYITDGMLKCSECGFEHDVSDRFSYCPNCGARMAESEE